MEDLRKTLKQLFVGGDVELSETLIEDLPEMDWEQYEELLHEWIPEALRDLLQEAGITASVYHLKDDIVMPEYVAEGIAEVNGETVQISLLLDVYIDFEAGEVTLLGATVYPGQLPEGMLPYYHPV